MRILLHRDNHVPVPMNSNTRMAHVCRRVLIHAKSTTQSLKDITTVMPLVIITIIPGLSSARILVSPSLSVLKMTLLTVKWKIIVQMVVPIIFLISTPMAHALHLANTRLRKIGEMVPITAMLLVQLACT